MGQQQSRQRQAVSLALGARTRPCRLRADWADPPTVRLTRALGWRGLLTGTGLPAHTATIMHASERSTLPHNGIHGGHDRSHVHQQIPWFCHCAGRPPPHAHPLPSKTRPGPRRPPPFPTPSKPALSRPAWRARVSRSKFSGRLLFPRQRRFLRHRLPSRWG